jgi:Holliday junction resolvasome RuvABC DNA-binding subunit
MKLYGIIYDTNQLGVDAYVVDESGKVIDSHFCSSENWALSDLGFNDPFSESSNSFHEERKKKYQQMGVTELVWLGFDASEFSDHLRQKITEVTTEWTKYNQQKNETLQHLHGLAEKSLIAHVRGIDYHLEKSMLSFEEIQKINQEAIINYRSNSSMNFYQWLEHIHYANQLQNG